MRDIHFYVRRVFDRRQGSETPLPAAVKRTACPGPGLWRGFQSCSYGILNDTACPNPLNGGRVYHRERRSATGFDYVLHILQSCSLYMISACCHRTRGTPDIDCGAGYIHNTTCIMSIEWLKRVQIFVYQKPRKQRILGFLAETKSHSRTGL